MKSWNDLTPLQRFAVGLCMLIGAGILPEIAFLINFGGMEIAFALVAASCTPLLLWVMDKLQKLKQAMVLASLALRQSASATPAVFALQAGVCVLPLALAGSGALAVSFFLPGMLFNGVLV